MARSSGGQGSRRTTRTPQGRNGWAKANMPRSVNQRSGGPGFKGGSRAR